MSQDEQVANQDVEGFEGEDQTPGLFDHIRDWIVTESPWWLVSFGFHTFILLSLAMIGVKAVPQTVGEAPSFDEAEVEQIAQQGDLERFEVGDAPEEPTELTTDTLTLNEAPQMEQTEVYYDDNPTFSEAGGGMGSGAVTATPTIGGLGGFDFKAVGAGPMYRSAGGGGGAIGVGSGRNPGSGGGAGSGFGGRGTGSRKAMVGSFGGTKQSERSVAGALNWIARHQFPDGRWSLNHQPVCKDPSCSGPGDHNADTAATAMGLLPFLAAGQTHQSKGPYRNTISNGLFWLMKNQKQDGDLRGGSNMYAHGLAAITLCEAYGLTGDKAIGYAAQAGLKFIENAQNPQDGGWRYAPRDPGDTSVVGWQLMALKSGMMAGLTVDPKTLEGVKRWLKSASAGDSYGGRFAYRPTEGGGSPTMTSVGLLCSQYLGAHRDDPGIANGTKYLMANMPNQGGRNIYYWYYATQVMHNVPGTDWDTWNRAMRRTLIDSQNKERDVCATGSWDPLKPSPDPWGKAGGRLMTTSLGALTLEVYYRYLPLYKLDKADDIKPIVDPGAAAEKKAG